MSGKRSLTENVFKRAKRTTEKCQSCFTRKRNSEGHSEEMRMWKKSIGKKACIIKKKKVFNSKENVEAEKPEFK